MTLGENDRGDGGVGTVSAEGVRSILGREPLLMRFYRQMDREAQRWKLSAVIFLVISPLNLQCLCHENIIVLLFPSSLAGPC